jgi:hypothetical protein
MDEYHHLATVRGAGSNPVFRSIGAGQDRFQFSTAADSTVVLCEAVKRIRPGHHGAFAFPTFPHAAVSARSALGKARS